MVSVCYNNHWQLQSYLLVGSIRMIKIHYKTRLTIKWTLFILITLSCSFNKRDAFGSETYYIDNHPVLLYKIINWWYDCLPDDSEQLCGNLIKCQNVGNTWVEYNEAEMVLKMHIKGGFAELLSIFKQCQECFGPSFLECVWLNEKYFGTGEAAIIPGDFPAINTITINRVEKNQVRLIRSIRKDIVFILEGVIGGLLSGRIALHHEGTFIKPCPQDSQDLFDDHPISLKIINRNTKELLVKYVTSQ